MVLTVHRYSNSLKSPTQIYLLVPRANTCTCYVVSSHAAFGHMVSGSATTYKDMSLSDTGARYERNGMTLDEKLKCALS